jgi:transposase
VFHWWHRVRDGTLTQASVANYMCPIRREVERWLEAGQPCGGPTTEGGCREILKGRQALTFVRHPGVDPTHNAAARASRPGGLWRNGSLGPQRAPGARVVEALMAVVATLTPQHRHALDSVTAAGEAALRGAPAPSWLPPADALNRLMPLAAESEPVPERLRKDYQHFPDGDAVPKRANHG